MKDDPATMFDLSVTWSCDAAILSCVDQLRNPRFEISKRPSFCETVFRL